MPKAKKSFTHKVTLKCNTESFEAKGNSTVECLGQIDPPLAKGFSVLRLETDGRSSEMRMIPAKVRRLKTNKITKEIFAKRLEMALK